MYERYIDDHIPAIITRTAKLREIEKQKQKEKKEKSDEKTI